jgi:hypothetical protein
LFAPWIRPGIWIVSNALYAMSVRIMNIIH